MVRDRLKSLQNALLLAAMIFLTIFLIISCEIPGANAKDVNELPGYIMPDMSMRNSIDAQDVSYDISTADDGYVVVEPGVSGIACEITINDTRYIYMDMPLEKCVFPLPVGSGTYHLRLARERPDSRYDVITTFDMVADIADPTRQFLMPNYMVNFSAGSLCEDLALDLIDAEDTVNTASVLCDWVHQNIEYDREREAEIISADEGIKSNIPDIDRTLTDKKGICLDQAALTTAMLRIGGIPAKLSFGIYRNRYHAWVTVLIDGEWMIADPTNNYFGKTDEYHPETYY